MEQGALAAEGAYGIPPDLALMFVETNTSNDYNRNRQVPINGEQQVLYIPK